MLNTVIPCALRHEMTLRRHGILKNTGVRNDPVRSAPLRVALRTGRRSWDTR